MKIYDETQHHAGIDLEGNDINKAKFPRIKRDGLFIDEVRSNPTTGLLEIWDGTQWLGYIDTGSLPEGESVNIETLTANKTLTASDATVQIYTSTASRVVNLPTTGLTLGQKFEIWNNNAYNKYDTISIYHNTSPVYAITAKTKIELRWDGTAWVTEWKYNISIGNDSYGNYSSGIGIGASANNNYSYGIGIGVSAYSNHSYGIGIGTGADNNNSYGIGIGRNARGNSNYSIGLGAFAGNGQSRANTLYIHSSTATVGKNSLIYGEFDNRILRINNTLYVNDLVGTGDRPVVADPTGKLKVGTTTLPTRTEYLSGLLTGTEHTFTGATLGITGDLRSRIKNIKCFAVDSSGVFNGALVDNEFIYETELVVNSATNLSGAFKIKLFIEYY